MVNPSAAYGGSSPPTTSQNPSPQPVALVAPEPAGHMTTVEASARDVKVCYRYHELMSSQRLLRSSCTPVVIYTCGEIKVCYLYISKGNAGYVTCISVKGMCYISRVYIGMQGSKNTTSCTLPLVQSSRIYARIFYYK